MASSQGSSQSDRATANGGSHLVLAPARSGWGETTLALRLGEALIAAGEQVTFLVQPAARGLFEGTGLPVELLGEEVDDALDHRLDALLKRIRPQSIILADLLMAATELTRRRAGPAVLSRFGLPIIAVDVWNLPEIDGLVDLAPGSPLELAPHLVNHPLRLVPVPFVRPSAPGACALLHQAPPQVERHEVRARLGLGPQDRLIFFATSSWQHRRYGHPHVDRAATAVPLLLGALLAELGERAFLLHVGPAPLTFKAALGDRYRHLPQLSSQDFHAHLAAADLLLSLNAPATTATAALVLGVPVLTVVNSFIGQDPDALWSWLGDRPHPMVARWAARHLPIHRFRMWPMGSWGMLQTLFTDNPYTPLLNEVELLDGSRFLARCRLLLDGDRSEFHTVRSSYLSTMRSLPGPADLVRSYLGT